MINKILSVVISIMVCLVTVSFAVSINSYFVVAEETTGCCTDDGLNYCVDDAVSGTCEGDFFGGISCSQVTGQGNIPSPCTKITCLEEDGSCSAQKYLLQCIENGGVWEDSPLSEVELCQAGCCQIIVSGEVVQQYPVIFGYQCVKDAEVLAADHSFTPGDCEILEQQVGCCVSNLGCTMSTNQECSGLGWFNQLCSETPSCGDCGDYDITKCYRGDVYEFNRCGEEDPSGPLKNCAIDTEMCGLDAGTGEYDCLSLSCKIPIQFTTLNYDTFYLKSGEVGIQYEDAIQKVNINEEYELTLANMQSGCVQYQGPGETHMVYTCNRGGVDITTVSLVKGREYICEYDSEEDKVVIRDNRYETCLDCSSYEQEFDEWIKTYLIEPFDWLAQKGGWNTLSYSFWDYWIMDPGECNNRRDCVLNSTGDKQDCAYHGGNHWCVPKYPVDSFEYCGEFTSSKAGSPFDKPKEACQSCGSCKLNSQNYPWLGSLLICFVQTAFGAVIDWAFTWVGGMFIDDGSLDQVEDAREEAGTKVEIAKEDSKNVFDSFKEGVIDPFVSSFGWIFSLGGFLRWNQLGAFAKNYFFGIPYLERSDLYHTAENPIVEKGITPDGYTVLQDGRGDWFLENPGGGVIEIDDGFFGLGQFNYLGSTVEEYFVSLPEGTYIDNEGDESIAYYSFDGFGQSGIAGWYDYESSGYLVNQDGVTYEHPFILKQGSVYYGTNYLRPPTLESRNQLELTKDLFRSWWDSGNIVVSLLLNKIYGFGAQTIAVLIIGIAGKEFLDSINFLSPQFWFRQLVCTALTGVIPGLSTVCNSKYLIPFLGCTTAMYIQQGTFNSGICVSKDYRDVGYENCYRCNDDSFVPCTPERCINLGTDCEYDLTTGVCDVSEEALQNCGETINDNLFVEELNQNGQTVYTSAFSETYYNLDITTTKYSECRYSEDPSFSFDEMILFDDSDRAGLHHNTSLWAGDPLISNYIYFVQCKWGCSGEEFGVQYTPLYEVKINKLPKEDEEPPVIIESYPYPAQLLEATNSVQMWVKADEALNGCEYASLDYSLIMEEAEEIIQSNIDAGATEEEMNIIIDDILMGSGLGEGGAPMILLDTNKFGVTLEVEPGNSYMYKIVCTDTTDNPSRPKNMLFRVSNHFDISIIYPEHLIDYSEYIQEITASSGAINTECRYSFETKKPYNEMTQFMVTGERAHSTDLEEPLSSGEHELFVSCVNYDASDLASAWSKFTIIPDTIPPSLIQLFTAGNILTIRLNEDSNCTYSEESFSAEQSNMIATGSQGYNGFYREFSLTMFNSIVYYIRCADRENNIGTFVIYP